MAQSHPSLEIVLEIQQTERTHLMSQLDSLDTKAGVTLGFSGVLVALGPGSRSVIGLVSIFASVIAAFLSVAAFWPRGQTTLFPPALGDYVQADPTFTRVRIADTLRTMLIASRSTLIRKGRTLKAAMTSLTVGAAAFAIEQIVR